MRKKDFLKNKKYYSAKASQHKGFTLIETLVAIFILVIAVTGPMSAAQNSLKASFLARDQIVAFYLAQDAIEYIKNIRDKEALQTPPVSFEDTWIMNASVAGGPGNEKKFNIDTVAGGTVFTACSGQVINNSTTFENIECPYMQIEDGYFVIDGDEDSKYRRGIAIKRSETNSDEFEIIVEVSWNANLFLTERRIVVQENIFNWMPSS